MFVRNFFPTIYVLPATIPIIPTGNHKKSSEKEKCLTSRNFQEKLVFWKILITIYFFDHREYIYIYIYIYIYMTAKWYFTMHMETTFPGLVRF